VPSPSFAAHYLAQTKSSAGDGSDGDARAKTGRTLVNLASSSMALERTLITEEEGEDHFEC
jgi:hypothetical protein